MFSERSDPGGAPNPLTQARAARDAAGEPTLDLTPGNPTTVGLPWDEAAALRALHRPDAYAPAPFGHPAARAAVSAALAAEGVAVPPSHVVMSASTSEAYAWIFHLLCDPGDEVLVPEPSYPLLSHLAHLTGVQLASYPLDPDGWALDLAALYEAIGPRTRAIVAVSPNNPTGQYLRRDSLAGLAAFELPLIVDEVFYTYPLDAPDDRARAASCEDTLIFALDGLSKRAALPQLKLAWTTVTGPGAHEALARLEGIADTFLSVATPVQLALAELLALPTAPDAIRARTRKNLATLRERVAGTAITAPPVEGGWYAPIRLPATRTDEAWALSLLAEGVHVHPGYLYDFPHDQAWLVLGLIAPEDDFARGVDAIIREARR